MALMKHLDRTQRLTLLDFSLVGFNAAPVGLAVTDLSAVIHPQWADGAVITGVEVFRAIWEAVGLGFLSRLSRLPMVAPLMTKAYGWFARNRLWLTGRMDSCFERCRTIDTPKPTHPVVSPTSPSSPQYLGR